MKKNIQLVIVVLIVLCGLQAVTSPFNLKETTVQGSKCDTTFNTYGMTTNTTTLTLSITDGIGVHTHIKNIGDFNATNITTQITITGRLFNITYINRNGPYIAPLPPNETLDRGVLPIGIGLITVYVTISAANAAPVTKTAQGFLLLVYVHLK
jgi:hypothetical protein